MMMSIRNGRSWMVLSRRGDQFTSPWSDVWQRPLQKGDAAPTVCTETGPSVCTRPASTLLGRERATRATIDLRMVLGLDAALLGPAVAALFRLVWSGGSGLGEKKHRWEDGDDAENDVASSMAGFFCGLRQGLCAKPWPITSDQ